MNREIKIGAILSYFLLIANTIYGLIVTPYILKYVGSINYGVYKSVSSISASLAVMDLGLGATMTRYMAKYRATGEKEKAQNFAGMIFVQFGIIALAIVFVGTFITVFVDRIYNQTFSSDNVELARGLLIILLVNMVLRLLENLFYGIINGNQKFAFSNSVRLASVVIKFTLIYVLLPIVKNVLVVVLSETLIVLVCISIYIIYTKIKIDLLPKLTHWDGAVFKESFGYTLLMFIQSLTTQFNGNIDNIIIGAQLGATMVTIYSMALLIFNMYENLSGAIANLMLPNIMDKVVSGVSSEDLQPTVEKSGRYQFLILAAALGGFVVLGKDFYRLWLGSIYTDCYYLTLILIVPITFPMIQNVTLSILRAQNKMVYRTVTLVVSCGFNVVATVIGIKLWGYWGAAVGTSLATLLNLVMMNIYYRKYLGFKIIKLFYNIFNKILLCACIAALVTFFVHRVMVLSWFSFIANAVVYMIIYIGCLLVFGLNKSEKQTILGKFRGA